MTDEIDIQTAEEIAASVAPGGPVAAVREWLRQQFVEDNTRSALNWLTVDLRRHLATQWLAAIELKPEFSGPEMFEALVNGTAPAAVWIWYCAAVEAAVEYCEAILEPGWGVATRPRIIAPGCEMVLFVNAPLGVYVDETEVPAYEFVLEHGPDGWLISALPGPPAECPPT